MNDKNDKIIVLSRNNHNKKAVPAIQRALILQGGGSLGAYEAGVFRALFDNLNKIDNKPARENRLLFDIIMGTSIGAINGAIILSNYLKNKKWSDSIEKLEEYWNTIKTETQAEQTPNFLQYWDNLNKFLLRNYCIRRNSSKILFCKTVCSKWCSKYFFNKICTRSKISRLYGRI